MVLSLSFIKIPLDSKEIKPVNPKGNQSWIFIERTDAETEAPILLPLMWRTNSLEKTLMLGKIEGRSRMGWQRMRWDGWHYQLDGHEFEQALGVGDGQGSLACCSQWDRKQLDMTERLNWTESYPSFQAPLLPSQNPNFNWRDSVSLGIQFALQYCHA